MSTLYSKKMPMIVENSGERTSNFALGRRFYLRVSNNNNLDYSNCLKTSSHICANPIKQNDSSLRTQNLRLKNIGSGSMNLKNSNDQLNYFGNNSDNNIINNRLSKVRGGGSVTPKKYNHYKI